MISLIVRRFTGVNVQKPIGSGRVTRILSFFMQGPLKDRSRIQSWESRTNMVTGVGIRIVLLELSFPILRNYVPPPT